MISWRPQNAVRLFYFLTVFWNFSNDSKEFLSFMMLITVTHPTVEVVIKPHQIPSQNPRRNVGGTSSGFSVQSFKQTKQSSWR